MEKQTKKDLGTIAISVTIACIICLCGGMFLFKINTPMQQTQTVNVNTSDSSFQDHKININTASVKELSTLPLIGEDKAKAIIQNRPFTDISQLLNVKGIGETTYNKIKSEVKVK